MLTLKYMLWDYIANRQRPKWRGRLHALGVAVSIPAGAQLALAAKGATAVASSLAFSISMTLVFAVSSVYHMFSKSRSSQLVWRRIDHAAIYLLIAGTLTPLLVLTLDSALAWVMLCMVWIAALAGVVLKLAARADKLAKRLYMIIGWSAVLVPVVWRDANGYALILFATGGVIYTVAAIAFARNWPRLRPAVFGYHEVFHSATLVAGSLHYLAVASLVS